MIIRCRKLGEAAIFTFIDHDGSVTRAAAVSPSAPCKGTDGKSYTFLSPSLFHLTHPLLLGSCPVLLTLHGTGVNPENQAASYKYQKKSTHNWHFILFYSKNNY